MSDKPYNPFLTPGYLQELHNIDLDEAKLLCRFANAQTINRKQCYGDGSIIYPMWLKEKDEADKVINSLCYASR